MERVSDAAGYHRRVLGTPRWFGVAALIAVIASVLFGPLDAAAARHWCKTDPAVLIDGQLANILVMVPVPQLLEVDGATEIRLTIPAASEAVMVSPGVGFGYGENLTILKSSSLTRSATHIDIIVEVLVPGSNALLPVKVEFAPRGLGILNPIAREGYADRWITMTTVL